MFIAHRTRHRRRRCLRWRSPLKFGRRGPPRLRRAHPARLAPPRHHTDFSPSRSEAPLPSSTRTPPSTPVAPAAGVVVFSWAVHGPAARAARPAPARPPRQDPPDRRRLGLRAQVGRLPDARLRRRRRGLPAVAQRQADDALLPRAGVPRGPLRARRRGRPVRRAGPPGLRRARPAHPSRRVAHPHARRADARRASSPSTCSPLDDEVLLELPQAERRDRLGQVVEDARLPDAGDEGSGRGPAVAAGRRGRDRQAPGGARTCPASAWA